ncbi:hypothetical protein [Deminuibacter soli]|nr:hypothetical protein [Deminuibacter soli]
MQNELLNLKASYSFHDGSVENINRENDTLIIDIELLNFSTKELKSFQCKFYNYNSLNSSDFLHIDWAKSIGTILKYRLEEQYVEFFLEITNYNNNEICYANVSFNYTSVLLTIRP